MVKKEATKSQIDSIVNQRYSEWEEVEALHPSWSEEEKLSAFKIFEDECREIALQKLDDEEDSDIFEIDYEQVKADYDEEYFPAKEIKEISVQAVEEKKTSLKFDFISHCTNFSYKNDLALEIIFHSTFSLLLKHIDIRLEKRKIYHKLHLNWQQDSGTGKGEAFNEKNRILETYSKMYPDKKYKIKTMNGSETMESFFNGFETNKKKNGYDFTKPTIGSFQEADGVDMPECSYIFVEKRGQKQTKAELLLDALEGKSLLKRLAGWEGRETITRPNFVFFSSTRPIPEVQETIATSGLLQRTLPFFRNIDAKTRQEMNLKNIYMKLHPQHSDEEFEEQRKELCRRFRELVTFAEKNPVFTLEEPEDCYQLMSRHYIDMHTALYNSISRLEHQKIGEAFISRFPDKILILAMHNALSRKTSAISVTDIKNACDLITRIYEHLCLWIEQSIDENRLLKSRRNLFIGWLKYWFESKPAYTKEEFVKMIMDMTRYSKSYAYHLIETFSVGNNSLIKVENGLVMKNDRGV